MVEHASLRLHFQFARKNNDWAAIYEIEEFVRNCHAKIEDEEVFPTLRNMLKEEPDVESVVQTISRLEADHRLIDTIGEQIRQRTAQAGDPDTLRKRISLYATTVESHNSSEETLIFPYWRSDDEETNRISLDHSLKIIREFGLGRYFHVTGISERLLASVFSSIG
jgi:hemerythrin superfamily protein